MDDGTGIVMTSMQHALGRRRSCPVTLCRYKSLGCSHHVQFWARFETSLQVKSCLLYSMREGSGSLLAAVSCRRPAYATARSCDVCLQCPCWHMSFLEVSLAGTQTIQLVADVGGHLLKHSA